MWYGPTPNSHNFYAFLWIRIKRSTVYMSRTRENAMQTSAKDKLNARINVKHHSMVLLLTYKYHSDWAIPCEFLWFPLSTEVILQLCTNDSVCSIVWLKNHRMTCIRFLCTDQYWLMWNGTLHSHHIRNIIAVSMKCPCLLFLRGKCSTSITAKFDYRYHGSIIRNAIESESNDFAGSAITICWVILTS